MTYRDDLAAAHARIAVLEGEVAQLKAACARLQDRVGELQPDAEVGREAREQRALAASKEAVQARRATEKEFEQQLRAKMKRWQDEAEASVRLRLAPAAKPDGSDR